MCNCLCSVIVLCGTMMKGREKVKPGAGSYPAGLNSKPFCSIYVEKAYSTVDSDSSVGWGR